jgi:hypothetical protein
MIEEKGEILRVRPSDEGCLYPNTPPILLPVILLIKKTKSLRTRWGNHLHDASLSWQEDTFLRI